MGQLDYNKVLTLKQRGISFNHFFQVDGTKFTDKEREREKKMMQVVDQNNNRQ